MKTCVVLEKDKLDKEINVVTIKQTKGNIPINKEILNKYTSAKEIFGNESKNFIGKIIVKNNIEVIESKDILNLSSSEAKKLSYKIFKKFNAKTVFLNDGNKIIVSKSGVSESVEKIYSNKEQRSLLREHLYVFSVLGSIIEHATLVNQTRELKNRGNVYSWNYYFDGLIINGDLYHIEFDVRSMDSGENQYRIQRLQKEQSAHSGDVSNNTKILPAFGHSALCNNNVSQLIYDFKRKKVIKLVDNMS